MHTTRSRLLLLLLLPLLLLTMGLRQAPLVNPPPIAVPAGMTDVQVGKAIKAALAGRGWAVIGEQPDAIEASLHLRKHVAQIHIAHDQQSVRITYVSSSELKYEQKRGKPYIHKNYLGWIQNLVDDIGRDLQLVSAGVGG